MNKQANDLWQAYCAACNIEGPVPDLDWFGDTPAMADELLALVVRGTKQATCELMRMFETKTDVPKVGDYWIITDGLKAPRCIIRTTHVEIRPVRSAGAKFAYDEGEGDRSLAYWKREHDAYFTRAGQSAGFTYNDSMDAVFEHFELVWPVPRTEL